jgi:hypothetical protein
VRLGNSDRLNEEILFAANPTEAQRLLIHFQVAEASYRADIKIDMCKPVSGGMAHYELETMIEEAVGVAELIANTLTPFSWGCVLEKGTYPCSTSG